jgi:hypothetical protein
MSLFAIEELQAELNAKDCLNRNILIKMDPEFARFISKGKTPLKDKLILKYPQLKQPQTNIKQHAVLDQLSDIAEQVTLDGAQKGKPSLFASGAVALATIKFMTLMADSYEEKK